MDLARQWAEDLFGNGKLGDKRSNARLKRVAAELAEEPNGVLAETFDDPADLWGAYRLFHRDDCTYEAVTGTAFERVSEQAREPGEVLLIEDSTDLDFTHRPELPGAGRIGNDHGRGWMIHSTLALRIRRWDANEPQLRMLGLLRQNCWARLHAPRKKVETRRQRMLRARESERWAAVFEHAAPGPGAHWYYVADRESDIFEVFERCRRHAVHFVVRACKPRALEGAPGNVFEAVGRGAVLGRYALPLRARPGVKSRVAQMEIRTLSAALRAPWRPDQKLASQTLNVIEVREVGAPPGVDPIHWVLLTDLPCDTFEQARRAIALYAKRWIIEEYHKALKSGTGIEQAQLETGRQVLALLGILALVAVRLLDLKFSAREKDGTIPSEFAHRDVLRVLTLKTGAPKGGWSADTMLCAIARLGGHLKHNGPPGWQTIWRGWGKLQLLVEGLRLTRNCVQ